MGVRLRVVGGTAIRDLNRHETGLEPATPRREPRARGGTDRLTDKEIAAWTRNGMKGELRDGQSMYLVGLKRGAVWRIDYRDAGNENTYTIGRYGTGADEFTLAKARAERGKVRAWLDAGLNPNIEKRAERSRAVVKQGETFAKLAGEWLDKQSGEWSPGHAANRRRLLENDLLPALGPLPIADLTPADILPVLKRIEARGAHEIAAKARIVVSMICRHAVITGHRQDDPAQHLGDALKRPPVVNRATVEAEEMPELFAALAKMPAELTTKLAFYFQIATAVRPGEVRFATWGEIDTKAKLWRIPAERMKMRTAFVQPLSALALTILDRADALRQTRERGELIFPGFTRGGHLSEAAFTALLARAGFYGRQTAHGFRAAFASWAHKREFDPTAVELCLAHRPGGVAGVYNRAQYIAARLRILTAWAEQLEAWGLRLP